MDINCTVCPIPYESTNTNRWMGTKYKKTKT